MIYSTWDIEPDGLKFLILGYFLPFNALTTWKSEFWENEKKSWGFHHFTRVPKIMIIWCKIAEIRNLKDSKNEKKKKTPGDFIILYICNTPGDIIILHMCAKNYYHMMYGSLDMVRNGRMCRLTDGKSDIEVGAPPKKV